MYQFPIKNLNELHSISYRVKWQYFEKLVAWIFEQNDFDVKQNVVIKSAVGKRQFDVIAAKYDKLFLVDCKKWRSKGQRIAALKSAVKKHLERCDIYSMKSEIKSKKSAASDSAYFHGNKKIIPVIVTLLEEDIMDYENVPIVPIMKLDWFLNNVDFDFPVFSIHIAS